MADGSSTEETAEMTERTGAAPGRTHAPSIVFIRRVEAIVLYAIAVVLTVLAILLLAAGVFALYQAVATGHIREQAIEILDAVLLVMMTMEIAYTVILSVESHKLVAEPFLIVGIIAAIRRMLVITATSTGLELANPQAFTNTLIELALLALTVLALAVSIWILRRSEHYLPPEQE
jgi:hypothetical protein